jgi:hypothetical protein
LLRGALVGAIGSLGCTGAGSSSSLDGSPGSTCVPGQSIGCVGPGPCDGYQLCASDGARFGPCICGGAPGAASDGSASDGSSASADAMGAMDGPSAQDATGSGGDAAADAASDHTVGSADTGTLDAPPSPPDSSEGQQDARAAFDSCNPLDGALFCSPSPTCSATGNPGACYSTNDPSGGCGQEQRRDVHRLQHRLRGRRAVRLDRVRVRLRGSERELRGHLPRPLERPPRVRLVQHGV